MTDLNPTFSGEVQLAGWRETHKSGAVVSFFLSDPEDLEKFRGLTVAKGKTAGQRFACVLVEIGDDELPVATCAPPIPDTETNFPVRTSVFETQSYCASPIPKTKPFGKQASELYRSGFFYIPAVLEAIGTDAEFLDWIRAQPCAVTGERDYHKDEATGIVTERCDPAHVRTVANGAGTAIKPPYCAIPLVHHLRDVETRSGKAALYLAANVGYEAMPQHLLEKTASEWMDKLRNKYVVEWASHRLASFFGKPSMGHVDPQLCISWCFSKDISIFIPAAYR